MALRIDLNTSGACIATKLSSMVIDIMSLERSLLLGLSTRMQVQAYMSGLIDDIDYVNNQLNEKQEV